MYSTRACGTSAILTKSIFCNACRGPASCTTDEGTSFFTGTLKLCAVTEHASSAILRGQAQLGRHLAAAYPHAQLSRFLHT